MNIVIVGLGVIGGSFALALKQAGYGDVYGVDSDAQTLEKAADMGIIRKGCTEGLSLIHISSSRYTRRAGCLSSRTSTWTRCTGPR